MALKLNHTPNLPFIFYGMQIHLACDEKVIELLDNIGLEIDEKETWNVAREKSYEGASKGPEAFQYVERIGGGRKNIPSGTCPQQLLCELFNRGQSRINKISKMDFSIRIRLHMKIFKSTTSDGLKIKTTLRLSLTTGPSYGSAVFVALVHFWPSGTLMKTSTSKPVLFKGGREDVYKKKNLP